jgi:hypothetical protein
MRITVKQPGRLTFWIGLPTWMVFNSLTAKIAAKVAGSKGVKLDRQDLLRLAKELRRMKRKYRKLELINAEAADGHRVRIRL